MKDWIFPLCVILILAISLIGPNYSGIVASITPPIPKGTYGPPIKPVFGAPLVFNESDNWTTYEIPVNTEFTINLTETIATNEHWETSLSPGIVQIDTQYFANPAMPRFDIQGTQRWTLRATKTGIQFFTATSRYDGYYAISFKVIPESG